MTVPISTVCYYYSYSSLLFYEGGYSNAHGFAFHMLKEANLFPPSFLHVSYTRMPNYTTKYPRSCYCNNVKVYWSKEVVNAKGVLL